MYTIYNEDGSKRTQWNSKSSAVCAARSLKKTGERGLYVVNELNCEIVWNDLGQ
jgi:hypothetical protein